jgi:uncharacterized damage-inducible protein DinB
MKRIILAVFAAALISFAAAAQQSAAPETNPVSNAVRKSLERESKILTAAAEAMPVDKYTFRPTPEQMTFAHLVMHMAGSNNFLCSKISGTDAPKADKLTEEDGKEKLVTALKASFEYCTQALAKVDDANLGEQLPFFGGRTISRAGAMIALTNDFYDHYSMAAIYLRLNGVLPPTAQGKKEKQP